VNFLNQGTEDDVVVVKIPQRVIEEFNSQDLCIVKLVGKDKPGSAGVNVSGRSVGAHLVTCPSCGREAAFLRTLNRYYCFNCKRYVT